jgi:hypothetical protein
MADAGTPTVDGDALGYIGTTVAVSNSKSSPSPMIAARAASP